MFRWEKLLVWHHFHNDNVTFSRWPNYWEDGDSPIAQEATCRKLFEWMHSAPHIKLPIAMLQEAAKRFRICHQDFMPYLKYFIENHSSRDSKKKLTNYKNTILINNHFLSQFENRTWQIYVARWTDRHGVWISYLDW